MSEAFRKLLLVGVGPHARQFYLPAIARLGPRWGVRLCAAVEVESQQQHARGALAATGLDAEVVAVPTFRDEMPPEARARLDDLAVRLRPDAVVVATDPLAHRPYALWALGHRLSVLLDKPITTRNDAVSSLAAARGIEQDYDEILAAWRVARRANRLTVSVCAHRRYHPGIVYVLRVVRDVCRQTGCPVTDIATHHADGQWRLPAEMLTQDHHSYHSGHGKASHSGHHFFDCVYRYYQAGLDSGKSADSMRIYSSFIQPHGLLQQLRREDYERLFGADYRRPNPHTDAELAPLFQRFGEIDLNVSITFVKETTPVAQAAVNLLHNSFSRRCWLPPGADLYKGNGRVKHEEHRVHVGPFFAAAIHSYQAKDDHSVSDQSDSQPGGNNHFDILLFRNTGMIGGKQVEVLHLEDLHSFDQSRLFIDQVKEGIVGEFFAWMAGEIPEGDLRSPLTDHAVPVRMLGAVYESHILGLRGENPVVEKPLHLPPESP